MEHKTKLTSELRFKIFKVIHYFCTSITVKLALDPHSPFAEKYSNTPKIEGERTKASIHFKRYAGKALHSKQQSNQKRNKIL